MVRQSRSKTVPPAPGRAPLAKGNGKPPSQRQRRVNEEIQHALAWVLERGEVRDPLLAATPVTVTEVRTSPDLRNATAFVTPLGGGDCAPVLEALKRARPFLRHALAQRIELKYVPDLFFEADTSFTEYSHIDALLHSPAVLRDTHPEMLAGDEAEASELPEDGEKDGEGDGEGDDTGNGAPPGHGPA